MPVLRPNGYGYFEARWQEDGAEARLPLHTKDRAIAERELVRIYQEIRRDLLASITAFNSAVALNPYSIPRIDLYSDAEN